MSYYTSRQVLVQEGETVAIASILANFNYLRVFEPTITETQSAEFVIAGGRDQRRVAMLEEHPAIRLEFDPIGLGRILYWCLGSINATTIVPCLSSMPFISFARSISPGFSTMGETNLTLRIWGGKVDTANITFERGAVASAELNVEAEGATLTNDALGTIPTVAYTYDPVYYSDVAFKIAGTMMPDVGRIVWSIDNNLSRRVSCNTVSGYRVSGLLEGGLDITVRALFGGGVHSLLSKVLSRTGNNSVDIVVYKSHGGTHYCTISMPNCWVTEYPERIRGIEPYEQEVEFVAVPGTIGGKTVACFVTTDNTALL